MINDCSHKNLLVRDGTSQKQRKIASLDTSYAQPDERGLGDMLLFIESYAKEIQFYNDKNEANGSWEDLFKNNIIIVIARFGQFQHEEVLKIYQQYLEEVLNNQQPKKQLKSTFDLLLSLCYQLERWQIKSVDGYLHQDELENFIKQPAALELKKLIAYYKKCQDLNLLGGSSAIHSPYFTFYKSDEVLDFGFTDLWWYQPPLICEEWSQYLASISAELPITPSGTVQQKTGQVMGLLRHSLEKIIGSFVKLRDNHEAYLNDLLENYASHDPHLGLIIAFLRLYAVEQKHLNNFTSRHLKFYYQEVLKILKKDPSPDSVHLILELAKNITAYKIEKGLSFKAGKDDAGNPAFFHADKETVLNKAAISEIKSIFIDLEGDGQVYEAPVANSKDGLGAEFEGNPAWKPFGQSAGGLPIDKTTSQVSEIGFAIASEMFRMSEGDRWMHIVLQTNADFTSSQHLELADCFIAKLSGEEAWVEKRLTHYDYNKDLFESVVSNGIQFKGQNIHIKLLVEETEPALVDHDPEIHSAKLPKDLPTLYLQMQLGSSIYPATLLDNVVVEEIRINSGTNKKTQFLVETAQGLADLSKPFNLFGTLPKVGDRLFLGSRELLNKPLTKLVLHGTYTDFPSSGISAQYANYNTADITYDDFKIKTDILHQGVWKSDSFTSKNLFNSDTGGSLAITLYNDATALPASGLHEEPEAYDIDKKEGFIRLSLSAPTPFAFGHKEYPVVYAQKTMEQVAAASKASGTFDSTVIPSTPYTPSVVDFHLEYSSKIATNTKASGKMHFMHVYPFGHKQIASTSARLLPSFEHDDDGSVVKHNGELLLGISDLHPPDALSLLFKLVEGSEDPELDTPQVIWSYLGDNEWLPFTSQQVISEQTKNFIKTGLVELSIPKECNDKNTVLSRNYHWIKAAVTKNTRAVCQIMEIHAQGIGATFKDQKNDLSRLKTPLSKETIAKLEKSNASIKSVTQPYASFDGKPEETDEHYFLRVAERLRHKNRGITIWDFERLVLEEFPQLYKTKCINHAAYGFYELLANKMDSEFAPGYVTLVVVPKTHNINAINPYEPKVSKGLLQDIIDYLKKVSSPWVALNLKVLNPQYEQVQVECEVAFYPQYADTGFYENQLNEDLKKHLAPWAFEAGNDIEIGGVIRSSTILDFIEERYYVDYVKNFKVNHYVNEGLWEADVETITPTTARSVLVTYHNLENQPEHIVKAIVKSAV